MTMFRSTYRVLKFTAQNIFRNFWLSFIAFTIFVLTLLTVNAVLVVNVIADAALRSVEQKVEVTVYFEPETSEDLVKSAQGYLNGLPQVREVRYVSAEYALESFKDRHSASEVILSSLDEVGGNPFGDALVISAHSSDDFPFILEAIETPEYAPHVKEKDFTDYESIIERIKALSSRVRTGGFVLATFFGAIAVLIIFNTIRVAIYVHRDEISIMKLVGASDWFVRGPFVLEAFFYSFIATLFMAAFTIFTLVQFGPYVDRYFGEIEVNLASYYLENGLLIFAAQFIGLLALSMLTTLFAMRRYLRV